MSFTLWENIHGTNLVCTEASFSKKLRKHKFSSNSLVGGSVKRVKSSIISRENGFLKLLRKKACRKRATKAWMRNLLNNEMDDELNA